MLIGVDIIDIEKIIIDFVYRFSIVDNVLGFRINIYVHAKDNVKVRRVIKVVKDVGIPSYSVIEIFIKMKKDSGFFTNNRNYLFKFDYSGACYYLVDVDFFPV